MVGDPRMAFLLELRMKEAEVGKPCQLCVVSFYGSCPGTEIPPQRREESGPETTGSVHSNQTRNGDKVSASFLPWQVAWCKDALRNTASAPATACGSVSLVFKHSRDLFCWEEDLYIVCG